MTYKQLFLIACLMIAGCQDRVHFMSGIKGDPGAPGQDGSSCSVQQITTGAIITCTDSTSAYIANGSQGPAGLDGKDGLDGLQGVQGPTGPMGPIGQPGVSAPTTGTVTVVPLCGGITVYPVNFVEVALCINSRLYAVYSEHDGFMAEIVPGVYASNAHGNSCTLIVGTNCQVSH